MKKLIQGIIEFRNTVQKDYRKAFGKLAIEQLPDTLFIACSDSRVVPNTFASTNPGDLFVLRNVGNLVPPCDESGKSLSDESEAAAIEFAVGNLNVSNIVVCGHSECGAMRAILAGRKNVPYVNLQSWLRHGENSLLKLKKELNFATDLSEHNRLSQLNVIEQMRNVGTYPDVKRRIQEGKVTVHGWWFELSTAEVYYYDKLKNQFILIDDEYSQTLINGEVQI